MYNWYWYRVSWKVCKITWILVSFLLNWETRVLTFGNGISQSGEMSTSVGKVVAKFCIWMEFKYLRVHLQKGGSILGWSYADWKRVLNIFLCDCIFLREIILAASDRLDCFLRSCNGVFPISQSTIPISIGVVLYSKCT